ncbi:MAG: transglutaminase family protein [Candidatus Methanomethylophilaceae archaeon]|nr:transglutaminase family protein [Candidatus Methanomethylophilaceae archaeon]MDY5871800.1 transglutaminase family protein [Candidatus Methanomethylophilaceae archaeon]
MYKEYLERTDSIDFDHPAVRAEADRILSVSDSKLDYARKAYVFVRDAIPHSMDIGAEIVSRSASDVLVNGAGICWTKSCLIAALLRAGSILSGISYQRLTRADDDSEGYLIHAFNTVYIEDLDRWIRVDARGNKQNIHAEFRLDGENLAYPIRLEYGEIDYHNNGMDLDPKLVDVLNDVDRVSDIRTDFEYFPS